MHVKFMDKDFNLSSLYTDRDTSKGKGVCDLSPAHQPLDD